MSRTTRIRASLGSLAVLALTGLVALQLGSAATLEVRVAAPLQVIEMDIDIPDPVPVAHTVTVIVHRYDSSATPKEVRGNSPVEDAFVVPDGHVYTIAWSAGATVACSTLGYVVPADHRSTIDGEFTASAEVTHEVCTQTGNGTISLVSTTPADS